LYFSDLEFVYSQSESMPAQPSPTKIVRRLFF